MKRHVELQRGPGPQRRTKLKSRGKNYRPVPAKVREIVLELAGFACERCGAPLNAYNPPEFHHVLKRRHVKIDHESNIRALCHGCHRWTEEKPHEAEACGIWVRGNGRPLQKGQP